MDDAGQPPSRENSEHRKPTLEVRLLRYVAGALTAIAVVGGAGWLLQQRKKRKRDSE